MVISETAGFPDTSGFSGVAEQLQMSQTPTRTIETKPRMAILQEVRRGEDEITCAKVYGVCVVSLRRF